MWALIVSAGVLVVAVLLAPWWLRQKIIWQKAALPYLFRLADVLPTVDEPDAKTLHNLIQRGVRSAARLEPGEPQWPPELEPSLRSKITKSVMSAWMRCLSLQ